MSTLSRSAFQCLPFKRFNAIPILYYLAPTYHCNNILSLERQVTTIDPPPKKKNEGCRLKKKGKVSRTLKFKDVFKDFALKFIKKGMTLDDRGAIFVRLLRNRSRGLT
jgi:hypothetical protein